MNMPDLAAIPATPAELAELAKAHTNWITDVLTTSPRKGWTPTIAVKTRDGPAGPGGIWMHVLDVPFNEPAEKRAALFGLGRLLYQQQVIPAGAVMSTEAWCAPDVPGRFPADHPERLECVVLFGSSLGGRHCIMQRMVISRDPSDVILPGVWEPPGTEGEAVLLQRLWAGYFEHVMRKYGPGPMSDR